MKWLHMERFIEISDIEGIYCCEYASYRNRLSSFPPQPIIIFRKTSKSIISDYMEILPVEELDLNFTVPVTEKLFLTNSERTIVDMIRLEREERFIYESIESYSQMNKNLAKLYNVADFYNARDSVEKYIESLGAWLDDYYE